MSDQHRGLKTATHALVRDVGGVDAAAAAARVGRSMLSDYGHPQKPGMFMPVDVVLDLERALRRPVVTQQLALAQGYDLVPVEAAEGGLVPSALAELGREVSALFGETAAAMQDGRLTEAECAALETRGAEARRALAALMSALAALRGAA